MRRDERVHQRLGLVEFCDDAKQFLPRADGLGVGDVHVVDAPGGGGVAHLLEGELFGEGQGDLVAAAEVDAVDLVALDDDGGRADHDDEPRDDEGGLGVFEEVVTRVLQNREHRHLLHQAAVDREVEEEAADDQRGEHGGENTDHQRDAEALHRTGAQVEHDGGGDERGKIAVENGGKRLVEAGLERGGERFAQFQFLAHALEYEDVRVHRHADGEHDARDAGHRKGGTDAGHHAEDDEHVERHRDDREQTARGVEADDKDGGEGYADEEGQRAALDRIGGEGRADLILRLHDERQVEGIVQHVGQVDGLELGKLAADFGGVAVDLLFHAGRGVEATVEHDGELGARLGVAGALGEFLGELGDLAGGLGELALAGGVELEDDAVAADLVHGDERVGDVLARHLPGALHEVFGLEGLAGAGLLLEGLDLVAGGNLDALARTGERIHEAKIEPRGLLHRLEHLGVVAGVDAGELDLDAVLAERTNDRLGDTETVDAVADDLDGLVELLATLVIGHAGGGGLVHLKHEGDAAAQI